MTWAEREAIFSKDVITLNEFMGVMQMDKSTASKTMCEIKRCLAKPRITKEGKLHVQDFIDYYRLDIRRYIPTMAQDSNQDIKAAQTMLDRISRIRGIGEQQ